jgi:hypothetical protein
MSSITKTFGSEGSFTSAAATEGVAFETSGSERKAFEKLNVTYSIQPVKSLISSSELIVDYMADKIEQSVSIQQIFNELLRFFETEAVCLGPSFRTSKEISTAVKTEGVALKTFGFRNSKGILSAPLGAPERKAFESFASEGVAFENLTSKEQKKISIAALNTEDSPGISGLVNSERPQILGFRILCSGRLQISSFSKPAEKAESIEITRGVLPLNSFQANIDFAQTYATNAYGTCGIKV